MGLGTAVRGVDGCGIGVSIGPTRKPADTEFHGVHTEFHGEGKQWRFARLFLLPSREAP
jgi:hypothetical protein